MSIQFIPLGGFGEVGRNSLAVDVNGDVFIFDLGIHLERLVEIQEGDDNQKHLFRKLSRAKALPDIRPLRKRMNDVKAIFCSHAHLDHVGGVSFLAKKFSAPIYATPFTIELIRSLYEKGDFPTPLHPVEQNTIIPLTDDVSVEFIHVAHSIPQSTVILLHTPEGNILYANDWKNDQHHPFDEPTNYARLEELAGKVRFLILDSLYAKKNGHSPSELLARKEVLALQHDFSEKKLVVATTFASHIHRLRSLCDLADSLGREVVFLGRSFHKYLGVASHFEDVDLSARGRVLMYPRQIQSFFKKLVDPEKYFLIVTGHQGEPKAILHRVLFQFDVLSQDDLVLFSCNTIPVPLNIENRKKIESFLDQKNIPFLKDVHVSGHAWADDHKQLISLLKPDFFIPAHGDDEMMFFAKENALASGLSEDQVVFFFTGKKYVF